LKSYFLIEIYYNNKNIEINKIINELIDNSLFFGVEIKFQLFKKDQYFDEKILLQLSIISDEFMNREQLDFYAFYLDTYFNNENTLIKSSLSTDIN
jgi:hypothetical protein